MTFRDDMEKLEEITTATSKQAMKGEIDRLRVENAQWREVSSNALKRGEEVTKSIRELRAANMELVRALEILYTDYQELLTVFNANVRDRVTGKFGGYGERKGVGAAKSAIAKARGE